MKKNIFKYSRKIMVAGFLFACSVQPCLAESLYEFYLTAPPDTLQQETRQMGKELARTFDYADITAQQQTIDFAEYFANMKKMILYGTRLGAYGDYQADLKFARDKEVIFALPEEVQQGADGLKESRAQRRFADHKFARLETNVKEEIDTYVDMVKLALDSCETLAKNDLTGFKESRANQERMTDFLVSEEYVAFQAVSGRMDGHWPVLNKRIKKQVKLWQVLTRTAGVPLIDPNITGALLL